jgi:hypothetical protein
MVQRVLVIDVGGTHLKILASGRNPAAAPAPTTASKSSCVDFSCDRNCRRILVISWALSNSR